MTTLLAILKLLPALIAGVQAIETALPIPAAGKAKLDLILGLVGDIYGADQSMQKQMPVEQMLSIVTATVSRVVSVFNSLGIFQKKTA